MEEARAPEEANRVLSHQNGVASREYDAGATVLHDGVYAAERERHDWATRHLRLYGDPRDALVVAREEQYVQPAVHLLDVGPVPDEADVRAEPSFAYFTHNPCAQRPVTRHHEMSPLALRKDQCQYFDCPFRPLLVDQVTDEAEQRYIIVHTDFAA